MATNRATRYPGRWGAVSADYPMGVPKNRTSDTAKDGSYFEKDWIADYEAFFGAILNDAGEAPNGTTDTATSSQLYNAHVAKIEEIATEKSSERVIEVSPRNNDWNGYLDPDHQSNLPAPNGYPGASGGGEVSYTADQEISSGIFAGSGGATVSSDSDGWIFTGSIYKLYDYTAEQLALIDINTVPVFVKDQSGNPYYLKNGDTGVTVTKPDSTTLIIEIDDSIFTGIFTKLWRFFVTETVGYVGEINPIELLNKYPVSKDNVGLIGNYVDILPIGDYSAGSFVINGGRETTDFDTIIAISRRTIDSVGDSAATGMATKEMIDNKPTTLSINCVASSPTVQYDASVTFTSATGFNISVSGGRIVQIIGYLREGV